jgi:hypothetical protein
MPLEPVPDPVFNQGSFNWWVQLPGTETIGGMSFGLNYPPVPFPEEQFQEVLDYAQMVTDLLSGIPGATVQATYDRGVNISQVLSPTEE